MRAHRITDGEAIYIVCEALESPVLANDGPVFEILEAPNHELFGAFYVVLDKQSGGQKVRLLKERGSRERDDVVRRVGTEWLRRNGPLPTDDVQSE
jgi:hypothetical protein